MKCREFSTPKGMDADILSAELPNEEVVPAVDIVLNIQEIYHNGSNSSMTWATGR